MSKLGNQKSSCGQGPQRQNRAVIVAWAFVHVNVGLEEQWLYTSSCANAERLSADVHVKHQFPLIKF